MLHELSPANLWTTDQVVRLWGAIAGIIGSAFAGFGSALDHRNRNQLSAAGLLWQTGLVEHGITYREARAGLVALKGWNPGDPAKRCQFTLGLFLDLCKQARVRGGQVYRAQALPKPAPDKQARSRAFLRETLRALAAAGAAGATERLQGLDSDAVVG